MWLWVTGDLCGQRLVSFWPTWLRWFLGLWWLDCGLQGVACGRLFLPVVFAEYWNQANQADYWSWFATPRRGCSEGFRSVVADGRQCDGRSCVCSFARLVRRIRVRQSLSNAVCPFLQVWERSVAMWSNNVLVFHLRGCFPVRDSRSLSCMADLLLQFAILRSRLGLEQMFSVSLFLAYYWQLVWSIIVVLWASIVPERLPAR